MSKISFLLALLAIPQLSIAQDFAEFEKLDFQTPNDAIPYRLLRPKEMKENQNIRW